MLLLISVGLIGCFLFTGCSTTHGNIGHSIVTSVQLSQANYTVLKTVSGSAKADYAFGIGPSEQDLRAQAKREMISKADLVGKPRALANVTTDVKRSCFLIWRQIKVDVTGEVIEFK
ncbi:MAG: DUF6567 family protein [Desulfobacterales bacterium]